MKKLVLLSVIALAVAATQSFAQTTPKKEFTVSLSEKNIELAPGATKTVDVTINRSKAYAKTNIDLSVGSTLPEGVEIVFEDGADALNQQKMIISTSEDVANFSKTLVLKAKSSRVSKGVMMKLSVSESVISKN